MSSDAPSLRESPVALTEADLRNMHHALGSPDGSWVTPYRNYYAVEVGTETARRFMETGRWVKRRTIPGGLTFFHVTNEGIGEVFAWLDAIHAERGLRLYEVAYYWGEYREARAVLATSPAAARYNRYLDIVDVWPDGFGQWLKRLKPTVRLVTARKDGSSPNISGGAT